MILAITTEDDVHAQRVAQEARALGSDLVVCDFRLFGESHGATVVVSADQASAVLDLDGRRVAADDVRSVWYRRPRRPRLAALPDGDELAFARAEWLDLLRGFVDALPVPVVNPVAAEAGAVKPAQLLAARRAGLRVPDTLITSSADDARAFAETHDLRVVHKALSAPRTGFLDTRRWSHETVAALPDLALAPAIFQEDVPGVRDVRVTVVGEELFAAEADITADLAATPDSRLMSDARLTVHRLPEDVTEAVRRLMSGLGLVYGAVDLRLDDRGQYTFFEVNPQGQFLYVEIQTGLAISAAMARLLARRPGTPVCSD